MDTAVSKLDNSVGQPWCVGDLLPRLVDRILERLLQQAEEESQIELGEARPIHRVDEPVGHRVGRAAVLAEMLHTVLIGELGELEGELFSRARLGWNLHRLEAVTHPLRGDVGHGTAGDLRPADTEHPVVGILHGEGGEDGGDDQIGDAE